MVNKSKDIELELYVIENQCGSICRCREAGRSEVAMCLGAIMKMEEVDADYDSSSDDSLSEDRFCIEDESSDKVEKPPVQKTRYSLPLPWAFFRHKKGLETQ